MVTHRASPVLPYELIMEILSWLPVKLLVRFTSVSKSWKSLIFDPTFVKLHLQRSPKNTLILLALEDIALDHNNIDMYAFPCSVRRLLEHPSSTIKEDGCYHLKTNYWLYGSSNGLVCLRGIYLEDKFEEYWVRFWNPATRLRSKKSPSFHIDMQSQGFGSWSKVNFGFGYDDLADTYKVVAIFWDRIMQKMEGIVHCMGDNCWRKIVGCPPFPVLLEQIDGQFVSGSVNWLALRKSSCCCYQWESVTIEQLVIFSLDLRSEAFRYLLLPDGVGDVPSVEPNLVVLRGCMCLFYDHKRTHFVVWQMREFGVEESWTRLVNVSYEHLQCNNISFHLLLPMCLSEDGDVLLLANIRDSKVIMYDWRDNKVENTQLPTNKIWLYANDYVQSLVLPCPN